MPYSEVLAGRIRHRLAKLSPVEEKSMMGGLVFMYREKMCVGIFQNQLMCRIDPDMQDKLLEKNGATLMELGCRKMNGYILVSDEAIASAQAFDYWMGLCIDFNKKAGSVKKAKVIKRK